MATEEGDPIVTFIGETMEHEEVIISAYPLFF